MKIGESRVRQGYASDRIGCVCVWAITAKKKEEILVLGLFGYTIREKSIAMQPVQKNTL